MKKILFIVSQNITPTTHWWMESIIDYLKDYNVVYSTYETALNEYTKHHPDAVFLSYKGAQPPSKLIGEKFWDLIKINKTKVAAWNNHEWNRLQDNDFCTNFDRKVETDLDYIFDYSWTSTNVLPQINERHIYVPYGYHDWMETNKSGTYDMEVSFLGCNRQLRIENDHRAEILNHLSSKFDVHVAGRWVPGQLRPTVKYYGAIGMFGGTVSQVSEFYKRSQIVLDLPWQDLSLNHFKNSLNIDKYSYLIDEPMHVTYRVLEAIGSGSLLVTLDCPMHRNLGLDETNCIMYKTKLNEEAPQVIAEAIERALKCKQMELRRNIEKLAQNHSYRQRWHKMLTLLSE